MKIWLLQIGEPYPFMDDVSLMRTGTLAKTLADHSHDILWWGSTFYHPRKQILSPHEIDVRVMPNLRIKLLQGLTYRKNISVRRYIHHKKVTRRFVELAESELKPDLIVASLPLHDLADAAVRYGQKYSVPVVVDIRDLWPDFFVDSLPIAIRPIGKQLLKHDFKKTSFALTNADSIMSISDDYMEWALAYAKREKDSRRDKVFYIGAQASPRLKKKEDKKQHHRELNLIPDLSGKIIFGFIGTFGNTYDLKLIVNAARYLLDINESNIHFLVAGNGERFSEIEMLSSDLSNLSLVGWLNKDQISSFLTSIDVGLAPYKRDAPQSLPNKPFQYLSAGIPVVSSLQGELSNILQKHDIGLTYEPEDIDSFVKIIQTLACNTDKLLIMGNNAQEAFENLFNASSIYGQVSLFLENFAKEL